MYIELSFMPNVELVSYVRLFVEGFYTRMLIDSDATSRVALATHELIENAIRYSSDGETRFRIDVYADTTPSRLVIRTWNRLDESQLRSLEEMFRDMAAEPDAFSYYLLLMKRNARREDGGSGLGLARIRAEAEMMLDFAVDDGVVCIQAHTQVEVAR